MVYTPSHRPQRGFRVPAVLVRADMGDDTENLRFWCTLGWL